MVAFLGYWGLFLYNYLVQNKCLITCFYPVGRELQVYICDILNVELVAYDDQYLNWKPNILSLDSL